MSADATTTDWRDACDNPRSASSDECRNRRCRSASLSRDWAGGPRCSLGALLRGSLTQPIIRRERILHQYLAAEPFRNALRHTLIAIELPVRKVRGKQQ